MISIPLSIIIIFYPQTVIMTDRKQRRQSFKAYSTEPKSVKGSFSQYIEESGANALLIEAVTQLFDVPEKPESPVEWFRCYFRQSVPERDDILKKAQQTLKDEIIRQESRLTRLRSEENRLKERIECHLYDNMVSVEAIFPKPNHDQDFRRYKDHQDDCRYRIKPDPMYQLAKTDALVHLLESDNKKPVATDQSTLDALKTTTGKETTLDEDLVDDDIDNNYDDYPKLYFGAVEEESDQLNVNTGQVENSDPRKEVESNLLEIPILDEFQSEEEEEHEEINDLEEEEAFGKLKFDPTAKRVSGQKPLSPPEKPTKKDKKKGKGRISHKERDSAEIRGETGKGPNETKVSPPVDDITTPDSVPMSEETGSDESPKTTESRRKSLKDSSEKILSLKASKSEELPPLPEDPLLQELEPIDPSYWKEDFSLTKGHENLYLDTSEFEYEDEEDEDEFISEGGDNNMGYLSSRGEKRRRKFRSQIIQEYFWKPDRGKSIQFDSKFDLADIPALSSNVSTVFMGAAAKGVSGASDFELGSKIVSPSFVSVIPSEASMREREKDFLTRNKKQQQ